LMLSDRLSGIDSVACTAENASAFAIGMLDVRGKSGACPSAILRYVPAKRNRLALPA
jgi:hypothetical protein